MDSRGFVVLTLGVTANFWSWTSITLTTLIHLFGIRLASLVNDTGVWTEMFGVLGVGTILTGVWTEMFGAGTCANEPTFGGCACRYHPTWQR